MALGGRLAAGNLFDCTPDIAVSAQSLCHFVTIWPTQLLMTEAIAFQPYLNFSSLQQLQYIVENALADVDEILNGCDIRSWFMEKGFRTKLKCRSTLASLKQTSKNTSCAMLIWSERKEKSIIPDL